MFGKKQKKIDNITVVTTKEQLKAAVKRKDANIEVRGDLAKKMSWMAKLSPQKIALVIAVLTGAAAAAVPTGGASVKMALRSAGVETSKNVAVIVAVIGGVTTVAILNGYSVKWDIANGILSLTNK